MKKDKTTAGPATLAASPETTNIPAPIEAPTPTNVTSNLPSVRDNAWVGVVVVEDDENVDWVARLRRRFQKDDGCGACSILVSLAEIDNSCNYFRCFTLVTSGHDADVQ